MIKISVDEAFAYDLLSILSVKSAANPAARPDWDRLIVEIIAQVGQEKHDEIMAQVYPALYAFNCAASEATDFATLTQIEEQHQQVMQQLRTRFQ